VVLQYQFWYSVAYAENSRGGAKFRHKRVTSQINARTTILGGSGGMPPGKFCKITPKNTQITPKKYAFAPKNTHTVYKCFYFEGLRGGHGTVDPPPYASVGTIYFQDASLDILIHITFM